MRCSLVGSLRFVSKQTVFGRAWSRTVTKAARRTNATSSAKPVLLFDVMDTIVKDPFYENMAPHFGLSFEEVRVTML